MLGSWYRLHLGWDLGAGPWGKGLAQRGVISVVLYGVVFQI